MSKTAGRSRASSRSAPQVRYPRARARPERKSRVPRSPLAVLVGSLVVAALALVALVAASQLGGRGGESGDAASGIVTGSAGAEALLAGVPQRGIELGFPSAPVTLVEYADVQCPFCAQWSHDVFPALVDEYVRTGKVRLVFRGLAFVGPDSDTALRAALAAGRQNKLWNVVDLLYHNQGAENGGWVTEDFLRSLGRSVPGLDAERMLDERRHASVQRELEAAEERSRAAGVTGTPAFELGPTEGPLRPLEVESLDAEFFRSALDAELAR